MNVDEYENIFCFSEMLEKIIENMEKPIFLYNEEWVEVYCKQCIKFKTLDNNLIFHLPKSIIPISEDNLTIITNKQKVLEKIYIILIDELDQNTKTIADKKFLVDVFLQTYKILMIYKNEINGIYKDEWSNYFEIILDKSKDFSEWIKKVIITYAHEFNDKKLIKKIKKI